MELAQAKRILTRKGYRVVKGKTLQHLPKLENCPEGYDWDRFYLLLPHNENYPQNCGGFRLQWGAWNAAALIEGLI